MKLAISFILLFIWHNNSSGKFINGEMVTFDIVNKCPYPIWPATAPNAGHPVIAEGGFLLPSNQAKRIEAQSDWSGRFWARTGCNFTGKPSCKTGDCNSLLSCNGAIGLPPATLIEVTLQPDKSKPSFYDVSLVDGYNLPVSVQTRPADPKCFIRGCSKNVNNICPNELQVVDENGEVVACMSACLAFDQDVFCCRNAHGTPQHCKANLYSKLFKDACPSYFSYAFDSPSPLVNCVSKDYVITFCPSRWGTHELL